MNRARQRAAALEVIAAALAFGASVPAGKALLADVPPLALAGVLYLTAGVLLGALLLLNGARQAIAGLRAGDLLALALAVAAGGVVGPIALFAGLARVPAYAASLLLNLEAVFTVAIAAVLGHERLGGRGWAGAGAVVAGGLVLAAGSGAGMGAAETPIPLAGALLVVAACLAWAADNNLTRRVSAHDARLIVAVKGLAGGAICFLLAARAGELSGLGAMSAAAVVAVGAVSYGLSLLLYVRGLRNLGAALSGALFATAPAAGVLLAWLALGEEPGPAGLAALALMTGGAIALALDHHAHHHVHEPLEHAHSHEHDEHHRHEHTPEELAAHPHSHRHRHEPLAHAHSHTADIHHRHRHERRRRSS